MEEETATEKNIVQEILDVLEFDDYIGERNVTNTKRCINASLSLMV